MNRRNLLKGSAQAVAGALACVAVAQSDVAVPRTYPTPFGVDRDGEATQPNYPNLPQALTDEEAFKIAIFMHVYGVDLDNGYAVFATYWMDGVFIGVATYRSAGIAESTDYLKTPRSVDVHLRSYDRGDARLSFGNLGDAQEFIYGNWHRSHAEQYAKYGRYRTDRGLPWQEAVA